MKSRASKSVASRKGKPLKNKKPFPEIAPFPIVAIGASAGGLEAYQEFFRALPADTGMGFVLIQHLDPSHQSMLTEIIAKATRMPVEEVQAGAVIQPNRVYVIPPNALIALDDCVFQLSPRGKAPGQHLAVNHFMRSLAQEQQSRAIGIVFSGTGADGTAGMEDIKAEGGITFAQDPATAKYDGMPRSAIDSGCVDFILPPKDIAKEIRRIQNHPYVRVLPGAEVGAEAGAEAPDVDSALAASLTAASPGGQPGKPQGKRAQKPSVVPGQLERARELTGSIAHPSHERAFNAVLDQLRRASGVDFSQYKPNTIQRRAMRRMVILKLDSMGDYARYLKEHPEEADKLYDDVLIPVTSFFRDFEAFEALKTQVYPAIVKDKANRGTIRMWAPGCSTGEETYSLAMTLLEFLGQRASSFQIQIFGTDLNDRGIQKARTGLYRESIAEEISPERMKRFFVKVDEGYRVNKAVRDLCIFARQNLATDPPFSQMNLVACRNLLIYIQPVLQKKIVPILHYALKPSGFLVLGGSESVSSFPELFSTVDKKHRIYAKKSVASRLHYDFAQSYYPAQRVLDAPENARSSSSPARDEQEIQAEADRLVLKHHAPVGVVVNNAMEVVQFRGRTAPYLESAPGKPSLNVLKLARNGLAIELRTLIGAAEKKGASVGKDGIAFDGNGHPRMLNLSVTPIGGRAGDRRSQNRRSQISRKKRGVSGAPGADGAPGFNADDSYFLILFDDVTPQWTPPAAIAASRKGKAAKEDKQEARRLKRELVSAQDALRSAVESEDSLKEEFQSANEEILSANEELQSTNEELETSKEELQSANEELNTLNSELRNKNADLQDLSNDLANLLNSTRIPVVMLNRRLVIRRATPEATRLLRVQPSDLGRPLADIKLNLDPADLTPQDLEDAIHTVLDSLRPVEREVRDLDGHWHGLSIQPYRTQDNKIDGAVLALQDIDAVKSAGERSRELSEFFRGILDTVREPLLALDHDLRVMAANQAFLDTFEVSPKDTLRRLLYELGNGQWNIPALRTLLERVLPEKEVVTDFQVEHDFETIGPKTMLLNARRLEQENPQQPMILLAIEDITERRRTEAALQKSHADLQAHTGELERFNRAAVGREERMIELKREINELLRRQGEAERYPLDFERGRGKTNPG